MSTVTVKVTDASGHQTTVTKDFSVTAGFQIPLLGGCGIDNTEFNAFNAAPPTGAGPLQVRRTFDGALPASWAASKAGPDVGTGRVSMWSWKPNMTTFATDTTAQNNFRNFLGTIPAGHKVVLTAYHEPEDNINAGSFTLAQFKAVTNKVCEIVKAFGNTNIKTCFIIMGAYTFDNTSPYSAWDWDSGWNWANIDYVGIDPYRFKSTEPSLRNMLTIANFGRGGAGLSVMQHLTAWGKPVIIPEWGCTETSITVAQKATWIGDGWSWIKEWNANSANTCKIEMVSYFNTNYFADTGSQPNATWKLHDEALVKFQAMMDEARAAN